MFLLDITVIKDQENWYETWYFCELQPETEKLAVTYGLHKVSMRLPGHVGQLYLMLL